jgi:HPt (histidine-containing phosphotransfer) domain-containing protein
MEGEPDILVELGGLFMEKAPLRIKAIKDALVKADAEALYKEAHNLKSSSANLGAMQRSEICKELEALGRFGTLDRAMELAEKAEAEY